VGTTDEVPGSQAWDRKQPGLPRAPGKGARRACESLRHGTCTARRSREVGTGQGIAPTLGRRRTEGDFLTQVQGGVATDRPARPGHVVVDQRNPHQAAALVRGAAEAELALDVGTQGKAGSLHPQARRAALLRDPTHRIVLHSTPKHWSWLTQREIWVRRRVRTLRTRGSGPAGADRQATSLRVIAD
jgi:hypothetical protein